LSEFAVPVLADCCIVHVRSDDGRIELAGVACANPAHLAELRDMRRQYPTDPDGSFGPAWVIRTGEPVLTTEVPPDALDVIPDPHVRARLQAIAIRSTMIVPIRDAGRVVGS